VGIATWLLLSSAAWAQAPSGEHSSDAAASVPAPASPVLGRWIDLQNATLNVRYRFVDTSEGIVTANQLQHRETLRARVKFDSRGRYALHFGVFTGVRFTSGWDNTRWGISPAQKNLAFKALYLAAQPIPGIDVEAGGLYIVKGESTELTTYDDDGYVMGERITIRRPHDTYFDEIAVTSAYFTRDPSTISVARRFRHIDEPNYRHMLVRKALGKRLGVSADYTAVDRSRTWRQAIRVDTRETAVFDSVVVEAYQRTRQQRARGFAVTTIKTLSAHVAINAGYASIDAYYGGLNADRFNIGNRAFAMATYTFSPQFLASAFVTTAVGRNERLPQRTLTNIVFTYNALPALRRTGLF
jgi:hypothetical protein